MLKITFVIEQRHPVDLDLGILASLVSGVIAIGVTRTLSVDNPDEPPTDDECAAAILISGGASEAFTQMGRTIGMALQTPQIQQGVQVVRNQLAEDMAEAQAKAEAQAQAEAKAKPEPEAA